MKRKKNNKYEATYTTKYEYAQLSWRALQGKFQRMVKEANDILREVDAKGLRKYGTAFVRKYNTMLEGNTISNLATQKGMFSGKLSKRANLVERMRVLDQFISNPAVQAAKIEKDLNELAERLGFTNPLYVRDLFDIWREHGFEDYKDESDRLLIAIAEVSNKGGDMERFASLVEKMAEGKEQWQAIKFAEAFRDNYNAYGDWAKAEQFASGVMNSEEKSEEERTLAMQAELHRTLAAKERLMNLVK